MSGVRCGRRRATPTPDHRWIGRTRTPSPGGTARTLRGGGRYRDGCGPWPRCRSALRVDAVPGGHPHRPVASRAAEDHLAQRDVVAGRRLVQELADTRSVARSPIPGDARGEARVAGKGADIFRSGNDSDSVPRIMTFAGGSGKRCRSVPGRHQAADVSSTGTASCWSGAARPTGSGRTGTAPGAPAPRRAAPSRRAPRRRSSCIRGWSRR